MSRKARIHLALLLCLAGVLAAGVFGHGQRIPAARAQVATFGQNLNQVFLEGGMLRLPIMVPCNRPVVFILVVRRFTSRP